MMTLTLCLLLFAVSAQVTSAANQDGPLDLTSSDGFPFHVKLDDNYDLKWDFNSTHIVFEIRVKTNGYIGFGISHNGAMYPGDVILGWVSDGNVSFSDRHTIGHFTPVMDTSQDWHLVDGFESGEFTTLTMIRELDTCDSEDIAIKEGTTRVIYSYHPSDPDSDDDIPYHFNRRGTKSLLLLNHSSRERNHTALPNDVITVDFINQNYAVSGVDTTYICTMWKLPNITEKHHVIRYEPVINVGHEMLVHHMILYHCTVPLSEKLLGTSYNCYDGSEPEESNYCQHVFIGWAIGGGAFDYPEHAGHSLGTSNDPVYFRLETHYDNPGLRTDFVDNSGLRLYLTKQLRQHDAGVLEAGVNVDSYQRIPPYNSHFLSQGFCDQACLEPALQISEMNVFAIFLHAHLLGSKLRTRVIRNGIELPPLLEDNNYDFNFQETRSLPAERILKKGDALVVECEYDSSQRTKMTYGGLSTRHEMCLSFIMYYPRNPLSTCVSSLRMNATADAEHPRLDWKVQHIQDRFAQLVKDSPFMNYCLSDSESSLQSQKLWKSKLNITQTYTPPQTCNN